MNQMTSDLKPIYANLLRIGFKNYIQSEDFNHFLTEENLDEEWDNMLEESIENEDLHLPIGYDYEVAFQELLEHVYRNYEMSEFTFDMLLDFSKRTKEKIDLSDFGACFKDLNFEGVSAFKRKFNRQEALKDFQQTSQNSEKTQLNKQKVFIVHGHDAAAKLELRNFIKDDLELEPIILSDQTTESIETIIAKLQRTAKDCFYAIVLFTPDDKTEDQKTRARQNVVLEFGFFLGRFSTLREGKIIVIKKGDIEIPSDIKGVVYLSFYKNIEETFYRLEKEISS